MRLTETELAAISYSINGSERVNVVPKVGSDGQYPEGRYIDIERLKIVESGAVKVPTTSVVHTLDLLGAVYVNIFSCKPFDKEIAQKITVVWFHAKDYRTHFIERI